jgi:DNA/RNA-binding domain of Phe-tRNA-synthetase-like protein
LTRRALKQPQPFRINPIVDFYNGICLSHVVPSGAVDLDGATANRSSVIRLRRAAPGDTFTPAGESAALDMALGELAWFSDSTALSRHILWRQSAEGLVRPKTHRLLFISEYVQGIPDDVARAAAQGLMEGVRRLLRADAQQVILHEGMPKADVVA